MRLSVTAQLLDGDNAAPLETMSVASDWSGKGDSVIGATFEGEDADDVTPYEAGYGGPAGARASSYGYQDYQQVSVSE